MKIKSTVGHNVSFHKVPNCPVNGVPDYLTIPAGATLELEDDIWLGAYSSAAGIAGSLATGALVMVVDAVSPLSVAEIAALIKDQAGVEVDTSKEKSEVQSLATKLGVDLSAPVMVVEDEPEVEAPVVEAPEKKFK